MSCEKVMEGHAHIPCLDEQSFVKRQESRRITLTHAIHPPGRGIFSQCCGFGTCFGRSVSMLACGRIPLLPALSFLICNAGCGILKPSASDLVLFVLGVAHLVRLCKCPFSGLVIQRGVIRSWVTQQLKLEGFLRGVWSVDGGLERERRGRSRLMRSRNFVS